MVKDHKKKQRGKLQYSEEDEEEYNAIKAQVESKTGRLKNERSVLEQQQQVGGHGVHSGWLAWCFELAGCACTARGAVWHCQQRISPVAAAPLVQRQATQCQAAIWCRQRTAAERCCLSGVA